jgi:hypothetical protein
MAMFSADELPPGTEIEVRTRYLSSWARGFEVVRVDGDRVSVRRRADGVVLPVAIVSDDIRQTDAYSMRQR